MWSKNCRKFSAASQPLPWESSPPHWGFPGLVVGPTGGFNIEAWCKTEHSFCHDTKRPICCLWFSRRKGSFQFNSNLWNPPYPPYLFTSQFFLAQFFFVYRDQRSSTSQGSFCCEICTLFKNKLSGDASCWCQIVSEEQLRHKEVLNCVFELRMQTFHFNLCALFFHGFRGLARVQKIAQRIYGGGF